MRRGAGRYMSCGEVLTSVTKCWEVWRGVGEVWRGVGSCDEVWRGDDRCGEVLACWQVLGMKIQ